MPAEIYAIRVTAKPAEDAEDLAHCSGANAVVFIADGHDPVDPSYLIETAVLHLSDEDWYVDNIIRVGRIKPSHIQDNDVLINAYDHATQYGISHVISAVYAQPLH